MTRRLVQNTKTIYSVSVLHVYRIKIIGISPLNHKQELSVSRTWLWELDIVLVVLID